MPIFPSRRKQPTRGPSGSTGRGRWVRLQPFQPHPQGQQFFSVLSRQHPRQFLSTIVKVLTGPQTSERFGAHRPPSCTSPKTVQMTPGQVISFANPMRNHRSKGQSERRNLEGAQSPSMWMGKLRPGGARGCDQRQWPGTLAFLTPDLPTSPNRKMIKKKRLIF